MHEVRRFCAFGEQARADDPTGWIATCQAAKRITVGADNGFDTAKFVADMRDFNVTPHVAQKAINRLSAIDCRTTRHTRSAEAQARSRSVHFIWPKTCAAPRPPI